MQKQSIDFHELFQHVLLEARAAWRYRWHALIIAWCVVIVGALLVFSLPDKYESSAVVYADTNALTNPLLHGISVHPDVRQRLQIITQTLLARPNLETVADETGLSLRATSPESKDELLNRLGVKVQVRNAGVRNLYEISYTDADPKMAKAVVQAFVQILMNNTLGENTASNHSARVFLQQQVDAYSNRLNEADKKLATFRQSHMDFLPGKDGSGNYSSRLDEAQDRLASLQSQYARAGTGGATVRHLADPRIQDIDKQIAAYKQKLNSLLLSYTEQYPGVVSTRRMIKDLEARRESYLENPQTSTVVTRSGGNPRAALASQIAAQKQRVAEIKSNADKVTANQVTLQRLTRNYQTTKNQYDDLVMRLNKARMSQQAVQSGNNLKFRIISPPIVPLLPVGPHRGLLLLVVFVFAIGIALVFGFFLHKIKPVFTSLKSLRDFDDYPVIGTFSLMSSHKREAGRRREVTGYCVVVGLLAVVVAVAFAYNGYLSQVLRHVLGGGMS